MLLGYGRECSQMYMKRRGSFITTQNRIHVSSEGLSLVAGLLPIFDERP